jgi:hypothetical protein
MMEYLQQQFAAINKKLDHIIDLQIQTLKAVAALADEQRKFSQEVLSQLDRIEDTILSSKQILQAVLLSQWTECNALVNGPGLNGQFTITRSILESVIANTNIGKYTKSCYSTMVGFLDAYVKPAKWSGQIIAARNFPTDAIVGDPALQKQWAIFQEERTKAYSTASAFVQLALQDPEKVESPPSFLARVSQPVVAAYYSEKLKSVLKRKDISDQFHSFTCDQTHILGPALKELACFGLVNGDPSAPLKGRWAELLSADLIGPQAIRLIDTGIVLSTVVDFSTRTNNGSFVFVDAQTIEDFSKQGMTDDLRVGLQQLKGETLLTKLTWLAEANVLQQSIAYGDYTAELAEAVLYDRDTHSLNLDLKNLTVLQQKALDALDANPLLARNVVLLAMRHAAADRLGGGAKADAASYNQTYYALALQDFSTPKACEAAASSEQKLTELFPNWRFEYRVTAEQQQRDKSLSGCAIEYQPDPKKMDWQPPAKGSGAAVSVGQFYVLLPSALTLSSGAFELSDSLRLALAYRDRLSQAIIDRKLGSTTKSLRDGSGQALNNEALGNLAFALMNEGWGWRNRRKSIELHWRKLSCHCRPLRSCAEGCSRSAESARSAFLWWCVLCRVLSLQFLMCAPLLLRRSAERP